MGKFGSCSNIIFRKEYTMKKQATIGLAGILALAISIALGSCTDPSSSAALSSDTALDGLTVNGTVWQNANFSPDLTDYDFVVENDVHSVTIEAQARNGAARVEGTGQINGLQEGDNSHTVRVTAEDGGVREYKLTITRLDVYGMGPTDAQLVCYPLETGIKIEWKPVYGAESYEVQYLIGISGEQQTATINPPAASYELTVAVESAYSVWVLGRVHTRENRYNEAWN
jgi:hypothetical protein